MCTMVYLAAGQPLRLVAWTEDRPAFHVTELHESELSVVSQFDAQHVVYAGAHEGCGCGFQAGDETEDIDPEEYEKRRQSLRELAEYLRQELGRVGKIEVHACWDGEQSHPPENHRSLAPATFEEKGFHFLPREHSVIRIDAA
jgi:hypothetical protein